MASGANDSMDLSSTAGVPPTRRVRRRPYPVLPPLPVPSSQVPSQPSLPPGLPGTAGPPPFTPPPPPAPHGSTPTRRRGHRGGRRHKKAQQPANESTPRAQEMAPQPELESQTKPKRTR